MAATCLDLNCARHASRGDPCFPFKNAVLGFHFPISILKRSLLSSTFTDFILVPVASPFYSF
jgi:hypothetical protein